MKLSNEILKKILPRQLTLHTNFKFQLKMKWNRNTESHQSELAAAICEILEILKKLAIQNNP